MSLQDDLTVIILTFNEENHISRCLESVLSLTKNVIVVDSCSTDATKSLVLGKNVRFIENPWPGSHSKQLSWALSNVDINTTWVLRLDADEILTDSLCFELSTLLNTSSDSVNGVFLRRRNIFLGKELKYGGMSNTKILRLWRNGFAYPDERLMDEQIILKSGDAITADNFFYDHNLNSILSWINKHCAYAEKEALQYLSNAYDEQSNATDKQKLFYYKLPMFVRPFVFFIYRYFFKFGFLDGFPGLAWHFLQCLWYRFIIDLRILELKGKHK